MKKVAAIILSLAMLCTFAVWVGAYQGENYIRFSTSDVTYPTNQHIGGDSNGDGVVNMLDVMASLKYISGNKTSTLRDSVDTNVDGKVNVQDVLLILKHVLGDNAGLGNLVG